MTTTGSGASDAAIEGAHPCAWTGSAGKCEIWQHGQSIDARAACDSPEAPSVASTFTNFMPVDVQTAAYCESGEAPASSAWLTPGASALNSIAATAIQFQRRKRLGANLMTPVVYDTIGLRASVCIKRPAASTIRRMRPPASLARSDPAWLDRQYNARAAIADAAAILQRWADESAAARRRSTALLDIAYGASAPERLDYFPAAAPGAPLFVFMHGGYWRSLDKSDFSWVAPPLVDAGISVAIPNYALAPSARVETIVRQMLAAHTWLHRNAGRLGIDRRRIVAGGHSAGGHLAAMMLCAQWPRWESGLPRALVRAGVSISGLHDMRPVAAAPFLREDLRLDDAAAWRLSPVSMQPTRSARLLAAVGAMESDEFHRQATALAAAWPAGSVDTMEIPGRHHLSVLEALAEPGHALHEAVLAMCRAPAEAG